MDRRKKQHAKTNLYRITFISFDESIFIQKNICSIYEFDSNYEDSSYTHQSNGPEINRKINQVSLITNVKKIHSPDNNILNNLGVNGSDFLQANGVVWVEGPSDIVYIRKWLEMYARENNLPELKQGHYEYQMYGGTLLDSLCYMREGVSKDNEMKKLVSLFSFSRNAFLIADSDAVKNGRTVKDNSNFGAAKDYIAKEFEKYNSAGSKLGVWYKKGNTKLYSIEDYIDYYSKKKNGERVNDTKKIYAIKLTESWSERKQLKSFKHDLKNEIKKLYEIISSWNVY